MAGCRFFSTNHTCDRCITSFVLTRYFLWNRSNSSHPNSSRSQTIVRGVTHRTLAWLILSFTRRGSTQAGGACQLYILYLLQTTLAFYVAHAVGRVTYHISGGSFGSNHPRTFRISFFFSFPFRNLRADVHVSKRFKPFHSAGMFFPSKPVFITTMLC